MTLKFLELQRAKRHSSEKRLQKEQQERKIEYKIQLELMEKLSQYLEDNDRVMFEVHPKFVGEFINILDDDVLTMYDYEQLDQNKFIFSPKVLDW